jgi:SNF2 family DNA or RNA helicase
LTDIGTERRAGQDTELHDVLALYAPLLAGLRAAAPVEWQTSLLVDEAVAVWSRPGFDTFLSIPSLRFAPFDYQLQAARGALRRMRGRAILADEVGLGKTIEAGLILAELRLRGLADRTLVITPAGLVTQWREELERKFGLPTVLAGRERDIVARKRGAQQIERAGSIDRPVAVASLAAARRDPLKSALTGDPWDLIIVDEAHRVRAPRSASGKLIRELRSRHLLLLTATPVENRLQDLYEMVSLVAPGLLGTAAQFRAAHGAGSPAPGTEPRNVAALRKRTAEVMIRHRRSEVSVLLPQRLAETLRVEPSGAERDWYCDLTARVRAEGRTAAPARRLTLRSVAKLAGSSPAAAAPTLAKIGWDDLAGRAAELAAPAKTAVLLDQLRRFASSGEKVLVFTAFRQTLDQMAGHVAAAGVPAVTYHGSLPRAEKERVIAEFRDTAPVMLSTESAGEGRNLQFCHVMVNMDLPWNPMQIEQRLGRVHRVGQDRDVLLTNLVASGTIEERVLRVLEAKINLFELVVGELDMILGRIDDDFDFETTVFDAFIASGDDAEFGERMAAIGEDLARARSDYLASRAAIDNLVGDREGDRA